MRAADRARPLAVTLGLACGAAGCSAVEGVLPGSDATAEVSVARVVVLVPEEGRLAAEGSVVAAAVELALGEASVPGWTVSVDQVDDGGDAAGATAAAEEIAADIDVIAVVGGLSEPVVRGAQPVLDAARIPFVSPADTVPEHTRGAVPSAPQRPYESYFRTTVLAGDEPRVAAEYSATALGAGTVGVLDWSGTDVVEFAAAAERLGIEAVRLAPAGDDRDGDDATGEGGEVEPDAAGAEIAAAARRAGVEAIYVGNGTEAAGQVARALAAADLDTVVVGGPGLLGDEFLTAAGPAAEGAVAVVPPDVGPDTEGMLAGLAAELESVGVDDLGAVGPAAHDAGSAVGKALEHCLPPVRADTARAARRGCVAELGGVAFDGVTGPVSFDPFGDRAGGTPRVFVVRDGAWEREQAEER